MSIYSLKEIQTVLDTGFCVSLEEGANSGIVKLGLGAGALKLAGKLASKYKTKIGDARVSPHTASQDSKEFINQLMNR